MKKFLFAFLVFLFSYSSYAQQSQTLRAMATFNSMRYNEAIPQLKKAWTREKNQVYKGQIVFMLGECYRFNSQIEEALIQYQRAYSLDYGPEALLHAGQMLKMLTQYDEAKQLLSDYLEISPGDERAKEIMRGIDLAASWEKERSDFVVRPLTEINSEFRDFAPMLAGQDNSDNVMVFTSTRKAAKGRNVDNWTGETHSSIFFTFLERKGRESFGDRAKWSVPNLLEGMVNTNYHEGATTVDKARTVMYYTTCDMLDEDNMGCNIMRAKYIDGVWQPEELVLELDSGYVVGHPSLSADGKTLYFSSNMSGGMGGNDLYKIQLRPDGQWTQPKNLGSQINTSNDEFYPHIHESGDLYFASNGHVGMGGLDIFISRYTNGRYMAPENLKPPVNSSFDDFSITWNASRSQGYFASNRLGGMGKDDIYSVIETPRLFTLNGKVIDNKTGVPLDGVSIRLEGNDGSINYTATDNAGKFNFGSQIVKGETSYKMLLNRKKYLVATVPFSTLGIPDEEFEFSDDGYLSNTSMTVELDPISKPIVLPRIEYDFNSAELRPEGKNSLNGLVEILDENPAIVIELRSHTDHIGSDAYNAELSHARAQSCVDYLILQGVDSIRLVANGMGEKEPFSIPQNFESSFDPGSILTEDFIVALGAEALDEEARQYNRRTDFKVLGELVRSNEISAIEAEDVLDETLVFTIDSVATAVGGDLDEPIAEEEPIILFYTLKSGDNYGTVAAMFNVTVSDLRDLNGGLRATPPFEGMLLKVNTSNDYSEFNTGNYRLQRADNTFDKILEKTGLTEDQFLDWNPDFTELDIKPGVLIKISQP